MERNRAMSQKKVYCFSLIELLIVISVLAILVSLLLPALNNALEKARGAGCLSNQKQLGLINQMYANAFNDYTIPVGGSYGAPSPPYWPETLYQLDYLSESSRAVACPSLPSINTLQVYGINNYIKADPRGWGWAPFLNLKKPGAYFKWKDSAYQGSFTPSNFPFLADSARFESGMQKVKDQRWYFFYPYPASDTEDAKVHMRHSRRANILFLDGHASALADSILRSRYKFERGLNAVNSSLAY